MSDSENGTTVVSARVDDELEEQFMLALRRAQAEGYVPLNEDRAGAVRQLMRAFVNDPSIIRGGATDAEAGDTGEDS